MGPGEQAEGHLCREPRSTNSIFAECGSRQTEPIGEGHVTSPKSRENTLPRATVGNPFSFTERPLGKVARRATGYYPLPRGLSVKVSGSTGWYMFTERPLGKGCILVQFHSHYREPPSVMVCPGAFFPCFCFFPAAKHIQQQHIVHHT